VGLTNFGYNGVFTRDLFEAQIEMPGISTTVSFVRRALEIRHQFIR
jgi:hypothetical protein